MRIEVDCDVTKKIKFDFKKNIASIIKKIPKEHVVNLYRIQVLNYSPERHKRNSFGFYYGKREGEEFPRIVICVKNIFKHLPTPFLRISFIPKLFLARTIFHEVAHHYQRLGHGITKRKWEENADIYTKKMMNKYFKCQLVLLKVLFGPFILLEKILKSKRKRQQGVANR